MFLLTLLSCPFCGVTTILPRSSERFLGTSSAHRPRIGRKRRTAASRQSGQAASQIRASIRHGKASQCASPQRKATQQGRHRSCQMPPDCFLSLAAAQFTAGRRANFRERSPAPPAPSLCVVQAARHRRCSSASFRIASSIGCGHRLAAVSRPPRQRHAMVEFISSAIGPRQAITGKNAPLHCQPGGAPGAVGARRVLERASDRGVR